MNDPFVLLALSILPGLIYVSVYYNKDKYQKEPLGIILRAFFWGAAMVLPIGLLQTIIPGEEYNEVFPIYAAYMILGIGFTEEFSKWLVTRIYSYRKSSFDEMTDGLVYGACAAGGFAVFENIFYVLEHGFETGIIRSLLSVPGHIFWGAISGYWLAKYKFGQASKSEMVLKGLGVATISHGLFNTFLSFDYTIALVPFVIIYNAYLTRKYFRLALAYDQEHVHSIQSTTHTEEIMVELPSGSGYIYQKEETRETVTNPALYKILSLCCYLLAFVLLATSALGFIGIFADVESIVEALNEDTAVFIIFLVMGAIGLFLFYQGRRIRSVHLS
jgi:RsiW-degrading membrane proteinase PrsW (M82 family)